MKRSTFLTLGVASGLILGLAGCKKEPQADATAPLEQSFKTAEPEVQKNIQAVTASLKAGNYVDAARALEPVVTRRDLSQQQRQAIGVALSQVNQAIAANPSLDTKEMYELRSKMFNAVDVRPPR